MLLRVGERTACTENYRVYECRRHKRPRYAVHRWRCREERSCSACSKLWAATEGKRAEARLARFRRSYPPRHVVVSPPWSQESLGSRDEYARVLRQSWAVLARMGVRGGLLVVHPWRKKVRPWGTEWYYSMHVHAIVYGRVDADKMPTGWVVKTERFEQRSVAGTIAYLMDHAGYVAKGHVPHWHGTCSKRTGGPDPRESRGSPACSECGHAMTQVNDVPWNLEDIEEFCRLSGHVRVKR